MPTSIRIKKWGAGLVLAVVTAATAVAPLAVEDANASAFGCAFGNPHYGPTQYCVYISGKGKRVSYVNGDFGGSALVCNYRFTAEFFDTRGKWYKTYTTKTRKTCATGDSGRITLNKNFKAGKMCSTMHYKQSWGKKKAGRISVCHTLKS